MDPRHLRRRRAVPASDTMRKHLFGPLFLTLLFLGLLWAAREEALGRSAAEKLIRLHVLAASDSREDQARKLLVRDALLEAVGPLLEPCETAEQAEVLLRSALPGLERAAEEALARDGRGQEVRLSLAERQFASRDYGSFSLPAGQYRSLQAVIGDGRGRNWWCVLFPPLCLAASEEEEEEAFAVFSPAEKRLVTARGRVLKFRLLEWLEGLRA